MATPFIVYKASAGAGKTYTLVKEYLKMAFSLGEDRLDEGFRSILAITFTKKATAEMKDRILNDLDKIARKPAVPHSGGIAADVLDALNDDGMAVSGEQLQRMAGELRNLILHRYSDLSVSTIDSFMHRIVRTFAHDLGQPANFEVTTEQQKLLEEAVASIMSKAGTAGNEDLTDVLKTFADSRMEDGKGYRLDYEIENLGKQLFREDADERLGQLATLELKDFKTIRQHLVAEKKKMEAAMRAKGSEMLAMLNAAGLDVDTAAGKSRGYYNYYVKMSNGKMEEASKSVVDAFENGAFTVAKCPPALAASVDAMRPQLVAKYEEISQLMDDAIRRCNTCDILCRDIYSLAVLNMLDKEMHHYSHDNDIVHMSDFNKVINAVVEDEENPAPFVYERLGNRYRHLLIDEFQDTSVMQWHNLVPLVENGVSQGMESLVVGDGKQSIYRFRQGDVQQFVRLPHVDGMKHHGQSLSMPGNYIVKNIEYNRRSAEAIVTFNNELFSFLAREVYVDNPMVQSIYIGRDNNGDLLPELHEELRQKKHKKIKGHVEVNFVAKADADEAGFQDVNEAIYDGIMRTIQRLKQRCGYAYKDMVILTRTNAEIAEIGRYMMQHSDVPQTSTESFYLVESHAVMAVIAALRLLHNQADRTAEADLAYRLAALGIDGGQWSAQTDQWADMMVRQVNDSAVKQLNLAYLASLDLYDCCEEIVRELKLDGIDTLYVSSLLNYVANFTAHHRQDVGEFLQWFEESNRDSGDMRRRLSSSTPEEIDAVQLMTIHKAKGLGRPVVLCLLPAKNKRSSKLWVDVPPVLTEGDGPSLPTAFVELSDRKSIFDDVRRNDVMMSEVDSLNMLYVALTRATEQLYLFCPDPTDIKTKSQKELDERLAADRRYPAMLYRFVNEKGYDCGDELFVHPVDEEEERPKKQTTVRRLSYADWTERVLIASPSEGALTPLQAEKIRFGNYAHDLLAGVRHSGEVEEAIARFAATSMATDDEMHRLADLARRAVNDPSARRFFDPAYEVKNECEIAIDGHRERPDRVVFTPDETWVVDFKTGEHLDSYSEQVQRYCTALRQMGYPNVSGWLLYLEPNVEVEAV
ncbi:MAG: UvrD-helicase domain-containing protein [Bacteroidales bacterium]|nr:UvrD-helicase domain-containing protein [Bacteroidales bacterium]